MKNKSKKRTAISFCCRSKKFCALFKVFSLFLIFNLVAVIPAFSSPLQDIKLSIEQKNVPLSKVLDEIETKTGYSVLVRTNDIDVKEKVSITAKNKSLDEILTMLFKNKSVKYEITGTRISIYKPSASSGTTAVTQQIKTITGKVTDDKEEPLTGVNIVVKGIINGTTTDMEGNYTLSNVPQNATLEFSFIGMKKKEVAVKDKSVMNVVMEEDGIGLEEVVVIGYTSQKKGLLTGSIVSMNVTDEMKTIPTTSAGNLLAGKLAGVNVPTTNGIPGASPKLSIRTQSSFNEQTVMFVIDGIARGEGDFNNLSPNEIDNITVLKDAASAAIYGSRSAGGVVLVTTKRGTLSKPVFNYSYSMGIDTRTNNVSMTDAVQTGELYNRINGNSDPAGWAWSQEELDHFKTINGGWGYDQLDAVWQDPSIQTHNFSVTGGSEKVKYFAGTSYVKQQGFLDPLTYDKFNFRLNVTVDVTKNLQFFAGMGLTDNAQGNITWEGAGSLYTKLLKWQPDQPVYTDSGKPVDYGWIGNVGSTVNGEGGYNKNKFLKPQMVLNVTYKLPFLEGLSAKAVYSRNWAFTQTKEFGKNYEMNIMKREGLNKHIVHTDDASIIGTKKSSYLSKEYIKRTADWGQDYQLNFQLNYNHTFNQLHQVSGALVFERTESSGASVYGQRENFPVYLTDQFWAAGSARADTDGGGSTDWTEGRVSYIGQFNYSYANKYLLNFSFREDASMKFSPEQRWGFFPAGSLGWVISEESFFNRNTVDFLKFRVSAGLTGNDNVGGWQWQEAYKSGSSAFFGTDPKKNIGITYGSVVNPNLTWEKALSYNFGADINFCKNWSATAEYWYRKSYDILGDRKASLPTTSRQDLPSENYAKINAQGFDFSLGYRNRTGDFDYYGNLTLSYGWNKVIRKDYAENAKWIDIEQGKAMSYISGYRFDRILRTQEEVDKFKQQYPDYKIGGLSPEPGMMIYKDLSGPDGKPDGTIDSWDRDMLKANNFPIVYGLNLGGSWKGISIDMMFNGRLKQQKSFLDLAQGAEWNRMWDEWYDNSWAPEHTDAWLPRRVNTDASKTYNESSDFWYEDASFLRLKYLNISYTLPVKIYNGVFDRVKIFFSGTNLFTLGNFNHYDPEIGGGFDFPIMRSYSFGIDVAF